MARSQKHRKIQIVEKRHFRIGLGLVALVFVCCNSESNIKRVNFGDYDLEGRFLDDSIPDGTITYYIANSNELAAMKSYSKGILNGKAITFYNSKIIQTSNYSNGLELGYSEMFDSLGRHLSQRVFYFYGKKMGPLYTYDSDENLVSYEFRSFDNQVLYIYEFNPKDSTFYSDDAEQLESLNVSESIVNNEKKLRVFFYLVFPPISKITYQIAYLDKEENIVKSTLISESDSLLPFWEGYVDYPTDSVNLALVINKFDSVTGTTKTIITYMKSRN